MRGQWLGPYKGSNEGTILLDLDEHESFYEGYAFVVDSNSSLPGSFAYIRTPSKNSRMTLDLQLEPAFADGTLIRADQIPILFPNVKMSKKANVKIEHKGDSLQLDWTTDNGANGSATLPKSRAKEPSDYLPHPDVRNWADFKEFVSGLEFRRHIFRGQQEVQRLRTSFHRTGRVDLIAFADRDIKTLHRHISQRTKHIFDLDIPDQNGAFLNLIQHHGYPTPLLDWTYSPYVGAFFAFRGFTNADARKAEPSDKVRVFVFDQKAWCEGLNQKKRLFGAPHFSIIEFISIENERMVPQQSISSVTNLDDIESYIRGLEAPGRKYLEVIDLPRSERALVIKDLSTMGITAGSLFPGLDGSCEELKQRFFDC